jgi:hypothetical protein
VYGRDGVQQRALTLGDGIECLQVAGDDVVWTSHSEEGYFGNWEGCASLVSWDARGRAAFRLSDLDEERGCMDVPALNLVSARDCWFICASELWHLRDRRRHGTWELAGLGSRAFAVAGQDVLLAGAWGPRHPMSQILDAILHSGAPCVAGISRLQVEDQLSAMLKLQGKGVQWHDERDEATQGFSLCWLKLGPDGATRVEGDFVLRAADGEAIEPTEVRGRGSRLFVLAGETLHEVALADVVGG